MAAGKSLASAEPAAKTDPLARAAVAYERALVIYRRVHKGRLTTKRTKDSRTRVLKEASRFERRCYPTEIVRFPFQLSPTARHRLLTTSRRRNAKFALLRTDLVVDEARRRNHNGDHHAFENLLSFHP